MSRQRIKKAYLLLLGLICTIQSILIARPHRRSINKNSYRHNYKNNRHIEPKTLIWDLGGTLVETSKLGMASKIGTGEFIKYTFTGHNPKKIQNHIFRTLEQISDSTNQYGTKSENAKLPGIMCQWLEGKKSGNQIAKEANDWIAKNPNFFANKQQAKLVNKSIRAMFNSNTLAANLKPIKQALEILSECKNQLDQNGKCKHRLLVLSNLDAETFECFARTSKGQEIFKHFDPSNIIISGQIDFIKPDPRIYSHVSQHVQNKYGIKNPANCVLIDDQEENIIGARQAGMKAVHIKNGNFKKLRTDLTALNII